MADEEMPEQLFIEDLSKVIVCPNELCTLFDTAVVVSLTLLKEKKYMLYEVCTSCHTDLVWDDAINYEDPYGLSDD